jgi:hypothetical protein
MASTQKSARLPVLMHVTKKERLHKVFVIHDREQVDGHNREFRVLTKEKADGTLELLGYNYEFDGMTERQSNVLRAPSVPTAALVPLIRSLVEQTHVDVKQMQAIDLTQFRTRLDQADSLAQHDLLDAFDFE